MLKNVHPFTMYSGPSESPRQPFHSDYRVLWCCMVPGTFKRKLQSCRFRRRRVFVCFVSVHFKVFWAVHLACSVCALPLTFRRKFLELSTSPAKFLACSVCASPLRLRRKFLELSTSPAKFLACSVFALPLTLRRKFLELSTSPAKFLPVLYVPYL